MMIYRIYLRNYKRIYNGTGQHEMELLFDKASPIIKIQGPNGCGKSTLLTLLTPLPDPPSEIIPGMDGMKVIVVIDDTGKSFTITYYYSKGKTESASITKYDESGFKVELNTSGNVTTAKEIVYSMFGLDANFEALTMMSGYGRKSLATMRPSERKGFISSILNNLDVYSGIYKTLSKRSSIFKALVNSITSKINNIGSPDMLVSECQRIEGELSTLIAEKERLLIESKRVVMTEAMAIENEERKKTLKQLQAKLDDIQAQMKRVKDVYYNTLSIYKGTITLDDTIEAHYDLLDEVKLLIALRDKTKLKMNELSSKLELLASKKRLIELDTTFQKMQSYLSEEKTKQVDEARSVIKTIESTYPGIERYAKVVCDSNISTILKQLLSIKKRLEAEELLSFNYRQSEAAKALISDKGEYSPFQVVQVKHGFYEDLASKSKHTDTIVSWLDDIDYSIMNSAKIQIRTMFDTQVKDLLDSVRDVLEYTSIFSIDHEHCIEQFQLDEAMSWYDACVLYSMNNDIVTDYAAFVSKSSREKYHTDYTKICLIVEGMKSLSSELDDIKKELSDSKYQNIEDGCHEMTELLRIAKLYSSHQEEYNNTLMALQELAPQIVDDGEGVRLRQQIDDYNTKINQLQNTLYRYRFSIDTLNEYMEELTKYKESYNYTEVLKKYCSPSTGIQIVFVELYMNKIIDMANSLLSHLFGGQFTLQPFVINESEFRIPVIGNGLLVDDVSSMSSSQIAMINMCVSFAILAHSSSKYRILRMDELDGPLDTNNRLRFTEILREIMDILGSQQCFIVSHNMELNDIDFQVIKLGGG